MYYPTTRDVEFILKRLNKTHRSGISVINRGQLEFALEKPRMTLFGAEQYPELHQKAAILMETVTKSHPFSDGNKRTAMMIAEYMIRMNGGKLIVPLKAVRLSIDTAKDAEDAMGEEIQMWFKTHTATSNAMARVMLEENFEEELVVPSLLKQEKYDEAETLVDSWLAFDTYPEHKQMWSDLVDRWKRKVEFHGTRADPTMRASSAFRIWNLMAGVSDSNERTIPKIENTNLVQDVHSLQGLERRDSAIKSRVSDLEGTEDVSELWSSVAIFERFEFHKEALECLERICQLVHDKDLALAHKMDHLIYFGLYDECVRVGEELLQRTPNDSVVVLKCSYAYQLLGKNERALELLGQISEKDQRFVYALRGRGYVLSSLGRQLEAAECFERVYEMRPDDTLNIKNKAISMSVRGSHAESIEWYDRVLERDPHDVEAWHNRGLSLYKTGDRDGAMSCYKKALEIDPHNSRVLVLIGEEMTNQGKLQEGLAYSAKALEINLADKAALLHAGITLCKMGKCEEALKNLNVVINAEPGNVRCLHAIAAAYAQQGNVPDAIDMLEKIARLDPQELKHIRLNKAFERLESSSAFQDLVGTKPRDGSGST